MRILFFIFTTFSFLANAQIDEDSIMSRIYSNLIDKLNKQTNEGKVIFGINDYYYDLEPRGALGIVTDSNRLIYSERTRTLILQEKKDLNIRFLYIRNFLELRNAYSEDLNWENPTQNHNYFYIEPPAQSRDFYYFKFRGAFQFVMFINVHHFYGSSITMEDEVSVYKISWHHRKKMKIKRIGQGGRVDKRLR